MITVAVGGGIGPGGLDCLLLGPRLGTRLDGEVPAALILNHMFHRRFEEPVVVHQGGGRAPGRGVSVVDQPAILECASQPMQAKEHCRNQQGPPPRAQPFHQGKITALT